MQIKLKPTSVIKARLGIQPGGPVQRRFTQLCAKHMDKYVPKNNGLLRSNVDIEVDKIVYKSPYAHYQYKGEMFVDPKTKKGSFFNEEYGHWSRPNTQKIPSGKKIKYHTPGTGSHWDKKMWTAEKEKVIKETQKYLDGGCK